MRASFVLALFSIAATAVSAYDVPPALAKFYDTVKNGGCQSYYGPERKKKSKPRKNALSDGHGKKEYGYCNDTPGVVYLTGKTDLGDMDVDCELSRSIYFVYCRFC